MRRIPRSLNAEGMAVVEAVVSMAAVAEAVASMEAVEAVVTFREVVATFRVAGGTTAPQAGGLSVAAVAIAAARRRPRTEAVPRTVDHLGRARERIVTQDAELAADTTAGRPPAARPVIAEAAGRRQRPGQTASGIPSLARRAADQARPVAEETPTLRGPTGARRAAPAQAPGRDPLG